MAVKTDDLGHRARVDLLADGAERLAEVLLIALDDDLELADRLRLLAQQPILVAVGGVWGQLRPREQCGLE